MQDERDEGEESARRVARGGFRHVSTRRERWKKDARVAQLVEHTLGKGEVIGSIPIASSGSRSTGSEQACSTGYHMQ